MQSRIILFSCPDQPGIIARLTSVLYETGVNILQLEQHVEERELFFMRICADVKRSDAQLTNERLHQLVQQLGGEIVIADPDEEERVAIFVTSEGGFLHDFYMQQKAGEVPFTIPLVISNREELQETAAVLGLPFRFVPLDEKSRDESENVMLELLTEAKVGLVVLARYMKILSGRFVEHYAHRMINIHHGFLPAFKGARPYRQAWERGVKVIGATAHYVTAELDAGPIIIQDVLPVTHRYSVAQMVSAGREIERRVLWQAVRAHLEHRVIVYGGRTIVFGE